MAESKKGQKDCTGRESNPARIEVAGGNDPGYHYPTSAYMLNVIDWISKVYSNEPFRPSFTKHNYKNTLDTN